MATVRQKKVAELIRRELGIIFQRNAATLCLGAMVTPTAVRISPDLGVAKVYVSIFAGPKPNEVLTHLKRASGTVRYELAKAIRNQLRKAPELHFYLDDSLDYAENIDNLLKE